MAIPPSHSNTTYGQRDIVRVKTLAFDVTVRILKIPQIALLSSKKQRESECTYGRREEREKIDP